MKNSKATADPSPAEAGFGPDSDHLDAKGADDSEGEGEGDPSAVLIG